MQISFQRNLISCAIFLDFAKAFDSVSHNILLRKLEKYGIRGKALDFFRSYLTSRSQFVKLNDVKSIISFIEFGVPQGSILGPLLFLLYINDLAEATYLFCKLYADDTMLVAQKTNLSALENEVNVELKKVSSWLRSNKLTLNMKKTKFMIITKKRISNPHIAIKINEKQLEKCSSYKYLGVVFDKDLNWGPHIEYICSKISKACGCLSLLRHSAGMDILREVYHALIHSYIRYGIIVWGNASETTLSPLKAVINRAIRIMTFAPFGPLNLDPLYDQLQILDLNQVFFIGDRQIHVQIQKRTASSHNCKFF